MKNKQIKMGTWALLVLAAGLAAAAGCGDDDNGNPDGTDAADTTDVLEDGTTGWECDTEHDGWERCTDNRVQYCHVVSGMDPHYHWGTDCESLGLTCVEYGTGGQAACADTTVSCAAADERCESDTAYFCVDGHLAQEPCGTAMDCHDDEGTPHCEEAGDECGGHGHLHEGTCHCDAGYVLDPDDDTNCIPETSFPERACADFALSATPETAVTAFADFPDAHMDLDQPYLVTLPDNQAAYVHFPVTRSGEYVIFLGAADRFDAFMHRSGDDVDPPATGGVPNGMCSTLILDHWHAHLVFDADVGADRVPYVVRFAPVAGGGTVTVLIKYNDGEPVEFPLDSCDLFRAAPTPEAPVTDFADFPDAHADLDTPYEITLPDNIQSYVHFPVEETGEYVFFLSDPSRFETVLHRSGSEVAPPPSGGVPNGMCSTLIGDHWHADLTFDGGTGDTRVPYVVRFAAVAGGDTITFMVRHHEE